MKKIMIGVLSFSVLALPAVSLAAGANLYNGGLGQVAGNTQTFGVAVCNGGAKAVSKSVPVTVATGGQTVDIMSVAPIAAGGCAYSYLSYAQLGMQAGQTYSVTVTIDPARTAITNTNNQTVYNVAVPAAAAAAAPGATPSAANQTANVNAQSGNFFTMVASWLSGLFGGK